MLKSIGKEYVDQDARVAYLKDNCDAVEQKGYMKRYTPVQLQQMKEDLSEMSIEINGINIEKKSVIADFKSRLKPLVDYKTEILHNLKQKAKYENEVCYKFIDHEEKMVAFYNSDGDMIDSRPLNIDEMQSNIFQITRKEGTNN